MPEKILIVDDDLETLRLVGLMLQRQGYQVASAHNGAEALSMARNEQPDLIVLDIMMPDMDGYEAIPKIRQIPGREQIPIIAVTAQAMQGDKEKCLAAGADEYISKPIDVDRLLSVLKEQLTEH